MLHYKHIRSLALSAMAIVFAIIGAGQVQPTLAQGKVVADTGFKPATDGFGFQNYGNDQGYLNLTPVEIRRMFGDSACAELQADKCTLTPPGQEWMNNINKVIGGGHCYGMAALATLIYEKKIAAADLGGDKTAGLQIAGNDKLQHEIAYWWAAQTTTPTTGKRQFGTPSEILKQVMADMNSKSDFHTVIFFQPDFTQGHAVTDYAVQDEGNGVFWLMIYDNNYPNQERHIVIDTTNDTWTYTTAADPNASANDYKGDATTKTLGLDYASAQIKPQDCPFCQAASSKAGMAQAAEQFNEVWLNDAETPNSLIHLLITDDKGNKLGYDNGKLVNTIPGAKFDLMASGDLQKSHIEPIYNVPTGVAFTVTVDGSGLKAEEAASVAMIGPGYDLAADNIKLAPGEKDTLSFSPDGKKLSYTPSSNESPDFIVGLAHTGADYAFAIKGFEVDKGAAVNLDLEYDKGTLAISTKGNTNPSVYALLVNRIDTNSDETFSHDGITLDPGATAYINFAKWDGKGDLSIGLDKQSDGTVEATTPESNQAK